MQKKTASIFLAILILIEISSLSIKSVQISPTNNESIDNSLQEQFEEYPANLLTNTKRAFTKNIGQLENNDILFYVQSGGLWFTEDGAWIEIKDELSNNSQESGVKSRESEEWLDPIDRFNEPKPKEYKRVILKQEFVGAEAVIPMGKEEIGYYSNFFYGNDSSKWKTKVPSYQEIYFENLYNGIDLRYYLNQNGIKYDLIVHPGADVQQIRVKYEGANDLEINKCGDLLIKTSIGDIVDNNLCLYQEHNGVRNYINGKFVTYDNLDYGFEILDEYNDHEVLVIDPYVALEYSTYLGGADIDRSNSIAADSLGNTYITGQTKSSNFPTSTGAYNESYNNDYDVFVTKLNPSASNLNYSTFIGGTDKDFGYGIVVDSTGNAFVTGETDSSDFPVTSGAYDTIKGASYSDVFILKLAANGSTLSFSTFVGGGNTEEGNGIALDSNGNTFIVGKTSSSNFPTSIGAYDESYNQNRDCFILKLNQTGSQLIYSTYLGGRSSDYGFGIDIDQNGNAYVTGITLSDDFPTSANAFNRTFQSQYDIIVSKLNNLGSDIIYSTYVGGTGTDWGYCIKVDSIGNAYVAGRTRSSNFPITNGAYDESYGGGASYGDGYVFKLNETGSKLIFSTYIGNSSDDNLYDIAIDTIGNVYLTGDTKSSNFPITPDAYQSSLNSSRDGFISKLSGDGSNLIFSSFLGGNDDDYCQAITLDKIGNVYVTGYTESSDFPNTPGVFNRTYNGLVDAFITKFSFKPFISVSSVLLLHNETPTNIAYSQLCPYTFKINVIDSVSKTDLKDVYLTLDPLGTNIQLRWNRSSGQFTKLGDPNNYISLHSSSNAENLINFWIIDFNIIFNWLYLDEEFHEVRASATSMTLSPSWFNVTKMYRVENDLVFNGTLMVTEENKHIINENDLVRGGQLLNWSGLTMVYENTTDVFPPAGVCNISLWDEIGNSWRIQTAEGEVFNKEIYAPSSTYISGFNYTINISGIPLECDATNITFTIRVDGDNVSFQNPSPNNITWQINDKVIVSVNITDIGGGEVNHSTVQQSISKTNGTIWSDWKTISSLKSDTWILVQDVITLDEGIDNLVKWRASDSIGNGPTESQPYRILVDTENIEFSNAWPMNYDISITEKVEVGITISDITSGVNASDIRYSISKDKGKTWSFWEKVEGINNSNRIDIQINITVPNGTDNMLKWRASDIAGNGPTESQPYSIKVNTWKPVIKPRAVLLSPLNGIAVQNTSVELTWVLEDLTMENILYDIYFENKTPPGIFKQNITDTNYLIDGLIDGETYYWRVVPKYGNVEGICTNGLWWFILNLPEDKKQFKITITGIELISLYQSENTSITLIITNLGSEADNIELKVTSDKLSEFISLNDGSVLNLDSKTYEQRNLEIKLSDDVQPGLYGITVSATSIGSGRRVKDEHIISVEIKEKDTNGPNGSNPDGPQINNTPEEPSDKTDNLILYSVIIIIIIVIILLVVFFVLKRKKLKDKEILPGKSITTKPIPIKEISIGEIPSSVESTRLSQPAIQTPTVSGEISTGTIQSPTISKTTSVGLPPQQMPEPSKTPQLPPAQPEQQVPDAQDVHKTPTLATLQPTLASPAHTPMPTVSQEGLMQPPPTPTLASVPSAVQGPTVHLPESKEHEIPKIEESEEKINGKSVKTEAIDVDDDKEI